MQLICPICNQKLTKVNQSAVCTNNHSFDYAKQGYLNLLIKQSVDHGDNKEMVQARTQFLTSDHYRFLKDELIQITQRLQPTTLADLGCGEGYYTSGLQAQEKYGFDMSKEALKHASKMDKTTQYAVASIFRLPLESHSCDMMITCFAPFAKEEIERVLKKDGYFCFVSPGPKHLYEMKQCLYETPYDNEIKPLDTSLSLEKEYMITNVFHCDNETLLSLFKMTPYYHRTKSEDIDKLTKQNGMDITAQFVIRIYKKQ